MALQFTYFCNAHYIKKLLYRYLGMAMAEVERHMIQKTLSETGGNQTRAAGILKIGLRTLQRKLKKYGLS